ncbi:MAG: DUF1361 domain-containing protein [Flavisolibacter sp.]|nr:DUF1361 domain-containing protein [Flavisolibacter sp.]
MKQNLALQQSYSEKGETGNILLFSCLFSILMLAARILYTGSFLFIFLIWNLFLAYIPYVLSNYILRNAGNKEKLRCLIPLFVIWLLFFPNSFYIITDLFHLRITEDMPLWFDLALIFSFAWNGLLPGILSLRQMEKLMVTQFKLKNELFFIYPIMCLTSMGIYIGRYLRFNSWDVLTNPFALSGAVLELFIHPLRNRYDWSMMICFSVWMMLIYFSIKKLSRMIR